MDLRVFEIFAGIQGESTRAGQPCAFVRLSGCDIGCTYCDTPQARDFAAGRQMSTAQAHAEVERLGLCLTEITGGEPLLQRAAALDLAARLLESRKTVMLETSGCLPLHGLDPRIEVVMDVKTPASGAAHRFLHENLSLLDANDEVKFVLVNGEDYQWARRFVAEHDLSAVRAVHFSPAWGFLEPRQLAAWIRRDNLPVRLAVQLHKILGIP